MRTQAQNPAIKKFSHLLPASGLYPEKLVDIFSSSNDDLKITDVEVVFIPRDSIPNVNEDREFWDAFAAYNKRWPGDLGNSCAGWLEQDSHLNPASVFGYFLLRGFASEKVLHQALREFAHIEECDWAREMLHGFEHP